MKTVIKKPIMIKRSSYASNNNNHGTIMDTRKPLIHNDNENDGNRSKKTMRTMMITMTG